eukprot:CAMPEP_0198731900 /NCGR_PEP_ID=MMETSP1475-20131203/32796_1 /TAXON_ID= ORGANISM="Unidentified sp., Strain CCMP1999" /NCGR_SAMPLE_ID=MMETSP1475 /ASSEMBLY_ACC=CAM_ASM_001111 /LENGTH=223 /DNA_ID=CAMNT_0044494921 /DNA_START=53 /DNA_END=725 /DNA_ORIENTATION=-
MMKGVFAAATVALLFALTNATEDASQLVEGSTRVTCAGATRAKFEVVLPSDQKHVQLLVEMYGSYVVAKEIQDTEVRLGNGLSLYSTYDSFVSGDEIKFHFYSFREGERGKFTPQDGEKVSEAFSCDPADIVIERRLPNGELPVKVRLRSGQKFVQISTRLTGARGALEEDVTASETELGSGTSVYTFHAKGYLCGEEVLLEHAATSPVALKCIPRAHGGADL